MAKLLLSLMVILSFTACNSNCQPQSGNIQKAQANPAASCPSPDPSPNPDPDPAPDPGDVPNEALTFNVTVQLIPLFEREQEEKVYQAIEIIKKVIATPEFRSRVLNFTYQGRKEFVDNRGMTNAQIYQLLLDGREDLLPVVDNEMDLELQLFTTWRDTVGYTTPGELRIYMNTNFFNPYTPAQVAGNIFHEWTHKLGFEHAQTYSVSRDSSVPYALGYLIEELGKKFE